MSTTITPKLTLLTLATSLLLSGPSQGIAAQTGVSLALKAYEILNQHCAKCHGENGGSHTKYMVIDRKAMVQDQKVVKPGNPERSLIIERITSIDDPMPPERKAEPLNKNEIEVLQEWIKAGAPDWKLVPPPEREFVSTEKIISMIEADAKAAKEIDRPSLRYFTLTHLYNAKAPEEEIGAFRTAFSKLINSLSWEPNIITPKAIDPEKTIVRIDLRAFGWSDETWRSITDNYPYALTYSGAAYQRLSSTLSCETPFIRADWFIAHASQSPLYEKILGFGDRTNALQRLEKDRLKIDTERNLTNAPGVRVWRSGFIESGVSENNRIVERHRSPYGAYWKSFDFAGNIGFRDITRYPRSFRHDGGEIIFNLPNGLQAYLLVDKFGNRLDKAPINIVNDASGLFPEIRNGISCMGCHSEGMIHFDSKAGQLRNSIMTRGHAEEIFQDLLALYVDAPTITEFVIEDEERFITAVAKTGAVAGGREPIIRLVGRYGRSLDIEHAAAEFGITSKSLVEAINSNPILKDSSLRLLLLTNGTIKRDLFESLFGRFAIQLEIGVNPKQFALLQQLLTKIKSGDLDAAFSFGLAVANGVGAKADIPRAMAIWKAAADDGHLISCVFVARLLAISDSDQIRNGRLALEYATKAMRLSPKEIPQVFEALAAAYAETGNFTEAVKWQRKAIELLQPSESHLDFEYSLKLYQRDKPLRVRLSVLFSQ